MSSELNLLNFDDIEEYLKTVSTIWESYEAQVVLNILKKEKEKTLMQGNEDFAKKIWCFEQVAKIYKMYIDAFREAKKKNFYTAWCEYEKIEIALTSLKRHLRDDEDVYRLEYISRTIDQYQKLYPYSHFLSPEFVKQKLYCSICGKRFSPRNSCGHVPGEIYNGECCVRIVKECEVVSISVVTNPVQKYSVIFLPDVKGKGSKDHYDYYLMEYLMCCLASPFHGWGYEVTKKRHPHSKYKQVGRNDKCPCGSGIKYKKCCLNYDGVLQPHYQFSFEITPTEKEVLKLKYSY